MKEKIKFRNLIAESVLKGKEIVHFDAGNLWFAQLSSRPLLFFSFPFFFFDFTLKFLISIFLDIYDVMCCGKSSQSSKKCACDNPADFQLDRMIIQRVFDSSISIT